MASRRKRDSRWEGREESGERWAVLSRAMCSSATMSAASAKIASTAAAELLLLLLLPEEDDGVVKLRATMAVSLTVSLSVSDVDERERNKFDGRSGIEFSTVAASGLTLVLFPNLPDYWAQSSKLGRAVPLPLPLPPLHI